jgi:hypothetical protein
MTTMSPPPPDASRPSIPSAPDSDTAPSSAKLSPRKAILNAAIVSLEYARQYLDKFTSWPDYILATHYHASVLALTDSRGNWDDAERCFKDVESWLQPSNKQRRYDEARKRIRAEAMYNRAVLLQRKGQTRLAKEQFRSVLRAIGDNLDEPPKGVRFATKFALLMLITGELSLAAAQDGSVGRFDQVIPPSNPEWIAQLSDWRAIAIPFLANCESECQRLENEVDRAERDLASLETKLKPIKSHIVSTSNAERSQVKDDVKQGSDIESKYNDARTRITKASKDLAILRMMRDTTENLQKVLSSKGQLPGSESVSS